MAREGRCGVCGAIISQPGDDSPTSDDIRRMKSHVEACARRAGSNRVEKRFHCDDCNKTWHETTNFDECPQCGEYVTGR